MCGKSLELLGRAEANALLSLSLHNLLIRRDMADEARIAWVLHLNASANAECMAKGMGVEAEVA